MLPPATWIGAAAEARYCSRKASYSISKVMASWPAVWACAAAIRRQIEGYGNAAKDVS
jgi:hypothetical protein